MSLVTTNNNGTPNNGVTAALPFVLAPEHPPTLMQLVTDLDDRAGALYDAVAEAEEAIERLEAASAELRRRAGRKRARDARYRARKRARQAEQADAGSAIGALEASFGLESPERS